MQGAQVRSQMTDGQLLAARLFNFVTLRASSVQSEGSGLSVAGAAGPTRQIPRLPSRACWARGFVGSSWTMRCRVFLVVRALLYSCWLDGAFLLGFCEGLRRIHAICAASDGFQE